ncbi:phenylalanine--tRNA ligase subunit alpha [Candidatus Woesearchaeota archaeon]|nr:phenylalanine--tRNA ligase subunit alpha [Candidatus Woesearchaeota archaeon]
MEIEKIIGGLHPLERKVLPVLNKVNSLPDVAKETGLQEVEVMRAFQWLQNKDIVKINEELKEVVDLDVNGKEYLKIGLPERRFLTAVKEKELPISALIEKSGISKEEVNICLGVLRGKAAIFIKKDRELVASITEQGKKLLDKESFEEQFLRREFPADIKTLKDEEKFALENLKKRKNIVKVELKKSKIAELTELGKNIIKAGIREESVIDRLTPKLIKTGAWKKQKFRSYDVRINVPPVFGGKKQHYRRFLDEARQKFLALGFAEIDGPIVETNFWDMDALFMPQFHSARDIHSAYFIKEPKYSKLDEKLVSRIKHAHENGFGTGSKGWQYKFDVKLTHRNILRTQGTACSARILASPNLKIPGKYFAIVRCFRPDVVDATHSADFNQIEGIVVEEGLNLRHLFGLLKMFAREFANAEKIKIVPGYFPFTEPSCELHAYTKELGWIELGGAGIFRPEMTKPLGVNVPVLAWGLGIDRLAMFKLGIKDIRELFSHNLEFLRSVKVV